MNRVDNREFDLLRTISRQASLLEYEVALSQVPSGYMLPIPPPHVPGMSRGDCLRNIDRVNECLAQDWKPGGNRNPSQELYMLTRKHQEYLDRVRALRVAGDIYWVGHKEQDDPSKWMMVVHWGLCEDSGFPYACIVPSPSRLHPLDEYGHHAIVESNHHQRYFRKLDFDRDFIPGENMFSLQRQGNKLLAKKYPEYFAQVGE